MNKVLNVFRGIGRIASIISLAAYGLIYLLYVIGALSGTNAAGPILAGIFQITVLVGLVGVLIFVLITKRDAAAKILAPIFLGWLVLDGVMGAGGLFGEGASAVMSILAASFLLAFVALFVIGVLLPSFKAKPIISIISLAALAGYATFQLIYAILFFVDMAQYEAASFGNVMLGLSLIAVIPVIVFLYIFCAVTLLSKSEE